MVLCTLEKTRHNMYWVTFENWLRDGRPCACAYTQSLIEYFNQSFNLVNSIEFMNERIEFELRRLDNVDNWFKEVRTTDRIELSQISLTINELIGDSSDINVEVDFANMDIRYGITGTQEEMLFGASPEMCVAMLFCNTMKDNEAITIQGARRVARFDGYGLNVTFQQPIPVDLKDWNERIVVCIDSLDLSEYSDELESLKHQLEEKQVKRELVKAYVGFSKVRDMKIDTGFWGCGAFGGHKDLKAIIQLLAASLSHNELNFNCFGDTTFHDRFQSFYNLLRSKNTKTSRLVEELLNLDRLDTNIFELIMEKFK